MTLFEGVHDFIYIEDFIRGIEILITCDWPPGEIVNFGSGVQTTNSEVLAAWQRVTGTTANVTFKDSFMRAHDTLVWQCDTAYAQQQYGFATEYTLDQGIADMIKRLQ
jgi:nucleoside-diphosphate-sugar epimerase